MRFLFSTFNILINCLAFLAGSFPIIFNLFGENPKESGQVVVGENTITYTKINEEINLRVVDKNGSVTEIIIPVAQFKF